MKYAKEVVELLSSAPDRDFRMNEIIYHVSPPREHRHRVRIGVGRVLSMLHEIERVAISMAATSRGSFARYRWNVKVIHDVLATG